MRALLALGPARSRAAEIGIDLPVLAFNLGPLARRRARHRARARASGDRPGVLGRASRGGAAETRAAAACARARPAGAAEVGLSLVLLFGAGLLLRTLHRLQATDPGSGRTTCWRPALPSEGPYGTPEAIARYADQVTARLAALPGVADVSAASINPLTQWRASIAFTIEGRPDFDREGAARQLPRGRPGLFPDARRPAPRRTGVDGTDGAESCPSRSSARRWRAGTFRARAPSAPASRSTTRPWRTVEIVGSRRRRQAHGTRRRGRPTSTSPTRRRRPTSRCGSPISSASPCGPRRTGPPAPGRAARDPRPRPRRRGLGRPPDGGRLRRLPGRTALPDPPARALRRGGAALALAGIYAVTAFGVASERARSASASRSVHARAHPEPLARQALLPVGAGLACGTAAALALGRLLSSLLVGVAPTTRRRWRRHRCSLQRPPCSRERRSRAARDPHRPGEGATGGLSRPRPYGLPAPARAAGWRGRRATWIFSRQR